MKKTSILSAFAVGILLASAAHAHPVSNHGSTSGSNSGSNSDSNSNSGSGSGSTSLCDQDIEWMKKAAQGDIFEITLGEIAQEKATEHLAKKFGRRMIKDHSKGLEDLQELAEKKGVELPEEPSEDQKVVIRYFKNSQSQDWDYDYLKYEVYDHKNDIAETKKEVEEGCDEDVKEEARKELPVLKEHLELAKEYSDKLEQSSSSGSGSDQSSDSSARGQAYP